MIVLALVSADGIGRAHAAEDGAREQPGNRLRAGIDLSSCCHTHAATRAHTRTPARKFGHQLPTHARDIICATYPPQEHRGSRQREERTCTACALRTRRPSLRSPKPARAKPSALKPSSRLPGPRSAPQISRRARRVTFLCSRSTACGTGIARGTSWTVCSLLPVALHPLFTCPVTPTHHSRLLVRVSLSWVFSGAYALSLSLHLSDLPSSL